MADPIKKKIRIKNKLENDKWYFTKDVMPVSEKVIRFRQGTCEFTGKLESIPVSWLLGNTLMWQTNSNCVY